MLRKYVYFACLVGVCAAAHAGFLKPVAFPKNASDLTFSERIELQTAGYAPYEAIYDAAGNCISGCAYSKMKLEDELDALKRRNEAMRQELITDYNYTQNSDGNLVPPEPKDEPTPSPICANCKPGYMPRTNPLGYKACITSPFGKRQIEGKTSVHYGIDFRAAMGTNVYAPANGTVDHIINDNKCGKGINIKHTDKISTIYCHLSEALVSSGDQITSGQLIAKTGNTGHSTGSHLHYGATNYGAYVDPALFIEPGHVPCN